MVAVSEQRKGSFIGGKGHSEFGNAVVAATDDLPDSKP